MGTRRTQGRTDQVRAAVAVRPSSHAGYQQTLSWWLVLSLIASLLILVSTFVANVRTVAAQEEPPDGAVADVTVQRLRIQVMPEFDDPRVLVIVQGRLAAGSEAFPLTVAFRVPRGAQINQMATMDMATGDTTPRSYEAEADPDDDRWSLVTYSLDNAHFFYEYYYDPLEGETDKQFTFELDSPQAVADLVIEIQQPLAATDFTMDPPATVARVDEGMGFTYHQFDAGSLEPGEEMALKISYTKANPEPSLTREEVMTMTGGEPEPEPEPLPVVEGQGRASDSPTWVLWLAAGLVALAGGVIWYYRRPVAVAQGTRDQELGVVQVSEIAEHAAAAEVASDGEPGDYCTQCGAVLKPDGRFCHVCGASVGPPPG